MRELRVKVLKNLEVGPQTYLMELEFPFPGGGQTRTLCDVEGLEWA
jgi:hypothetical protein